MDQKDKRSDISTISVKSKRSQNSAKSKKPSVEINSDDISVSQLELMANKKKISKKIEMSAVSESINNDSVDNGYGSGMNFADKRPSEHKISSFSKNSELSSMESSVKTEELYRQKLKRISKENRNDSIRKEKSELLYKFNKVNVKGKWSSLKLDMDCTLDEIRNEYQRVVNAMQNDRSVAFFKRILLLGVQGIEMLNNKFDPIGVDLNGWSEAMGYSLENQEYDEVMAELCEKYKGVGEMSPEVKLIFMIISSATMFTISKKITKLDSNDTFKNIIGNFMGGTPSQPSQPQTVYSNQNNYVSEDSDSSEDFVPSKIRDPNGTLNHLAGADNIDISNILRTMNERKMEKMQDSASENILKNISMNTSKRRGRPKKNQTQLHL